MSRVKKAAAAIYDWDFPLLTFIYPGFDCGSTAESQMGHEGKALVSSLSPDPGSVGLAQSTECVSTVDGRNPLHITW